MKSEKGVTLASLGIYIVVILIALITLTTITTYFQSNVGEFNTKNTQDLEFEKFNLYFIEEVKKTNNAIIEEESTNTKIVFITGSKYEFKDNAIVLNENVRIAENISECNFSFIKDANDKQIVTVYLKVGDTERTNEYVLSNQIAEEINNHDYIYGYKRVEGTKQVTLEDSIETNLRDYKIYGNSVQNGIPTTSIPVEIKSVGEKTKNLFNYKQAEGGNYISIIEDGLHLNGYAGGGTITPEQFLEMTGLKEGDTITISLNKEVESGSVNTMFGVLMFYAKTGSGVSNWHLTSPNQQNNPTSISVATIPLGFNSTNYGAMYIYGGNTTGGSYKLTNIQIEKGSTATEYEPYGKYKIPITIKDEFDNQITTNIFLDEPLRKIGDYADYIDFENQKLVRYVKITDDTGTLPLEESLQGMQEAIEARIGLPNIAIYEGINILTIDTEVPPSKTSVVYYSK